jgi:hypothetical protein
MGTVSKSLAFFALVLAVNVPTSGAAEQAPPQPPYLVNGSHHVLIGVVWDEAAVRKVLPSWVKPTKEMTGLINIYQVERGYGITPYEAVYFSLDVEGFDSASGVKGRWMLQGAYGPNEVTSAALKKFYQLPVRVGTSRFESTADGLRAAGSAVGREVVIAQIRSIDKPCAPASITLNYPTPKGLLEIPVIGESCDAEPVSVEVSAPAGDPFAAFKPVKLLWASEFRNGSFSFSRPVPY